MRIGKHGYVGELVDYNGDYLTRERFITLYDICGKLLHKPNPFDKISNNRNSKTDMNRLKQAGQWHKLIINLLTHHKFMLTGEEDTFYICYTTGPNAEFRIAPFQRLKGNPDNAAHKDVARARKLQIESSK